MVEPLNSQQVLPSHKFLWAVKTYLDLITRDDQLVFGSGLKRLYAMSSGVGTLNDGDIEAIVEKSERLKLDPVSLTSFMQQSIAKNIELYAKEVQNVINDRIIGIANGDIQNPTASIRTNAVRARRAYYTVPSTFLVRLKKALLEDTGAISYSINPPVIISLRDLCADAEFLFSSLQLTEGVSTPFETSWGELGTAVQELIFVTESVGRYGEPSPSDMIRSRSALKILWVIAKLLSGDLTSKPALQDMNLIDLDKKLNFTDGTLASIPFPLRETVNMFYDQDVIGLSLKGRMYLSAVSAAVFYRNDFSDND